MSLAWRPLRLMLMLMWLVPFGLWAESASAQPAGALEAFDAIVEQPQWQAHFDQLGAVGTIVVVDARSDAVRWQAFNSGRAVQRYSPASTYKIPHTLLALQAGVVADEFEVFVWQGEPSSIAAQRQVQSLRSAMRESTVWVYRRLAAALDEPQLADVLARSNYGNADPSGTARDYWLKDGALAISALEQVEFLRQLYANRLPFDLAHQRLVKDLIIVGAGRDWILRAKTGWDGAVGWWVGWVETPRGPVFFALNLDTPAGAAELPKREALGRAVLKAIDALAD